MALNKHWCAQGTIDPTQMIYRHILRRNRHTRNYTHKTVLKAQSNLHMCALMAQVNYTNVLSWHNAKLHTCALGAQWKTTHLCSRSTVENYTLVLSWHNTAHKITDVWQAY